MSQAPIVDEIRLPKNEEPVAAVTILDGNGSIVRIVPATQFRRSLAPPARTRAMGGRGQGRRGRQASIGQGAPAIVKAARPQAEPAG
jgi:hypothetical protein